MCSCQLWSPKKSILLAPISKSNIIGFLFVAPAKFCSWPRHLWGAWISNKSWHDWLQRSCEPVYYGASRTWTDANWIWHSLTNSGTIWLMPDWYRDLGGISLYYWPILGLGFQTTNCQSMCGTPPRTLSQRQEAKQLPPAKECATRN